MSADPRSLVAISFDSELRAREALTAAARLQSEGNLLIHDAVLVIGTDDGKARVVETTDVSTGTGALSGAMWGGLFGMLLLVPIAGMAVGAGMGAISAKVTDVGISDEFVSQLRDAVQPGRTVLALLTSHGNQDAVQAELARFKGAELVASTAAEDAIARVEAALAED